MELLLFLLGLILVCPPHLSLYFFPYCFSNQMSSASLPKGFLVFFSCLFFFFLVAPGPNSNFGTISTSFRQEPLVKKPPQGQH